MYFGNIDEFGVLDEAYKENELLALSFWCLWGNRFDWNDRVGTKGVNFILEVVWVVVVHSCLQLRLIRHEWGASFFDVRASLKNCSCRLKEQSRAGPSTLEQTNYLRAWNKILPHKYIYIYIYICMIYVSMNILIFMFINKKI